jgi:hypothetical protein
MSRGFKTDASGLERLIKDLGRYLGDSVKLQIANNVTREEVTWDNLIIDSGVFWVYITNRQERKLLKKVSDCAVDEIFKRYSVEGSK